MDTSYQFCIDYAVLHHLRFGTDFLATFGPWGFAYSNLYHPEFMGWMITAQVIVGVGMFAGIWGISRNLCFHPLVAGPWIILVSIWDFFAFNDGRMLAMCLFPMLIRRTNSNRRDFIASYMVVFALALAGLCKYTFFTLGAGAIGLLSLEDILLKRPPKLGIWFVAMTLVLWRITGQGIADLPVYLLSAWKLASGYSTAMGLIGPDFFMVTKFAVVSVVISSLVLARFWKADRLGAFVGFLTTAATLFMCFKEGFVRHDGHELLGTVGLTIVACICAPIFWVRWYQQPPMPAVILVRVLTIAIVGAAIWCLNQSYTRFYPGLYLTSTLESRPSIVLGRLSSTWDWIYNGNRNLDVSYADGLAAIRATCPLPVLAGTTDIYGFNQLAVITAGMDYQPRPLSPGFQAWSPQLIAFNRHSLLSDRAPENIFFMPETIDNQFSSLEEGALWPYLMTRYTPIQLTGNGYLVLRRLAQPRSFTLTPLSSGTFHLGEHISVPSISSGAIWMQIKLKKTFGGKLETLLLRSPEVYLNVKKTDGLAIQQRIIPGMAEAGFVLSPIVNDAEGFLLLMSHQTHLPTVTDVSVSVQRGALFKNTFNRDVHVTFQHLDVQPISPGESPDSESLVHLGEMANSSDSLLGLVTFTGPDGKWALLSNPPMHMHLSVPTGAVRLHAVCGISSPVFDKTDGVIFIVSAATANGSSQQLFSRNLQPKTQSNDRQQIQIDVPLSPSCTRLTFETRASSTPYYGWGYWSDVRFQ